MLSNNDHFSSTALFQKIETIANTKGAKAKAELVAAFTPPERAILQKALDPRISYYITAPALPATSGDDEWGVDEYHLLELLSSRKLSGNEAIERVTHHLRELNRESGELLRRVLNKDLRAGLGAGTVNKAFPGLIFDPPYMRCSLPKDSSISKWDWTEGMISQLKANGSFARVDVNNDDVVIATRAGNEYPLEHLKALREDVVWTFGRDSVQVHGEMLVWKDGEMLPRAEGNGILNSIAQGGHMPDGCSVRLQVWDVIPLAAAVPGGRYDETYSERFRRLKEFVRESSPKLISIIPHRVVYSYAQAMEHYKEMLALGLEGTVVKHHSTGWRDGDSKDQVKFKLEVDVDLKIVGFREGEVGKRTEHTFGSVLCQTSDGLMEVAVSGFKRDLELWIHEHREEVLGTIMCVRANEVSKPTEGNPMYSLYHPRCVELRKDKREADSLQRVLDQFAAAVAA